MKTETINNNIVLREKAGLPLVKMTVNKHNFNCLIDSGASVSLIAGNAFYALREGIKIHYLSRQCQIKSITNEAIEFAHCVEFSFQIGSQKCRNVFFVTKEKLSDNYDIIIGYDFLKRHKAIIDVNNEILQFTNKKVKFFDAKQDRQNETHTAKKIVSKEITNVTQNKNTTIKKQVGNNTQSRIQEVRSYVSNLPLRGNSPVANTEIKNKKRTREVHKDNGKESKDQQTVINNIVYKEKTLEEIRRLRREQLKPDDFELEHIEEPLRTEVLKLMMDNAEVFSKTYETLGRTEKQQPIIELDHPFPIATKPYVLPRKLKQAAKEEIEDLLKHGLIERSNSSYAAPILMVKKNAKTPEGNPKWRLAIDYRLLNAHISLLPVQIPRVREILNTVAGYKYYCTADLKAAYNQQLLRKEDREKCAFISPWGVFQPIVQNFGLRNSGPNFCKLMEEVLGPICDETTQFYLDDIIVAENDPIELLAKLEKVFKRLAMYNLTLDPNKLHVIKKKINFLGFQVSQEGIQPSNDNTQKIMQVPRPTSKKHIQSFMGLCNYFRFLIPRFAEIAAPLVELTRPKIKFEWSPDCENAWRELQKALTSCPVVAPPDLNKEFFLNTDASNKALGAILLQKDGENYRVIEYFSRRLNPTQQKYPAFKAELLAIKEAVNHFREYLIGSKFTILTDARSLLFNIDLSKQSDTVARWLMELSKFKYDLVYIPGKINPSDFLSREISMEPQKKEERKVNTITVGEEKINHANIKEKQYLDPTIRPIIDELKSDKVSKKTQLRYKLNKYDILTIKHKKRYKIMIPDVLRKWLIEKAHTVHSGIARTKNNIIRFYYWKKWAADVENFVASCHNCMIYRKKNIPNSIPVKVYRPRYVGETVALDILGKYPRSNRGHTFILNIIDLFSRFMYMVPIKNITAYTVTSELEKYFYIFGAPRKILSDNGSQMTGQLFAQLMDKWQIKHVFASVANPTANSIIERSHSTAKDSIAPMCNTSFDWDLKVREFVLWYNLSKHSQTNFAPAELFLVREVAHPLYPEEERDQFETYEDFKQYYENKKIMITRESIDQQLKCQEKMIEKAKFVRPRKFQIGQIVYMKNLKKNKALKEKFSGPYVISEIRPNNNVAMYRKDDTERTELRININKLVIAQERLEYLRDDNNIEAPKEELQQGPAFNLRSRTRNVVFQPTESDNEIQTDDDEDEY